MLKDRSFGCSHHCVAADGRHEIPGFTFIPYAGSFTASQGGVPSQISDEHAAGADQAVVIGSQDVTRLAEGVAAVVGVVAMLKQVMRHERVPLLLPRTVYWRRVAGIY
jgi:hypothetical protein